MRPHLDLGRVHRLRFALSGDARARAENWERAAAEVCEPLWRGKTCAFATIGDPNVYSTFTYLARAVREKAPDTEIATVPGITAMQDLASRSGVVLLEADERLALLPLTAGVERLRGALAEFETVVCYKGGSRMAEVLRVAEETGRLDHAVYGARLGIEGQEVLDLSVVRDTEAPYLSTVAFTKRGREFG